MNFKTIVWIFVLGFILAEIRSRFALSKLFLKELILLFIKLELFILWLFRKIRKPKYLLGGSCIRCGKCCEQIVSHPPRWFRERGWRWYAAFHRYIHRFTLVGRGEDGQFLFRCEYLQHDGRCGNYRHRPLLCRTYPLQPYYEAPGFIPGCSHTITPSVLAHRPKRMSLPILNQGLVIHHPTPIFEIELDHPEHYERIDSSGVKKYDPQARESDRLIKTGGERT